MFQWLRLGWYYITGQTEKYKEALAKSKPVMESVYNKSIRNTQESKETLVEVIASTNLSIKELKADIQRDVEKLQRWTNARDGAAKKSKERAAVVIANCKQNNITDPNAIKAKVNADLEYIKHDGIFRDVSSSIEEITPRLTKAQAALAKKEITLEQYKIKHRSIDSKVRKLEDEKDNALASIAYAKIIETENAKMRGVDSTSDDKDLALVRDAVKKAEARSDTLEQLSANDSETVEQEYANYAEHASKNHELEMMINLDEMIGKEPVKELNPAQLPE